MQKVIFYDINQINFYKYIPELLSGLSKETGITLELIFEEKTGDLKALEFLKNFNTKQVNLIYNLSKILDESVNLLVVNAQRIPDSLLVSAAKRRGIPTLMIQHGMYNGHLKRTHTLFLEKILKTLKYLIYSFKIGVINRKNPFLVSLKFLNTFARYESYRELLGKLHSIYTDYLHVYGDYWIGYHKNFFGYTDKTSFKIIGYPELRNVKLSRSIKACYIAQTIVEDGRGTIEDLQPTLEILKEISDKYGLLVKRHPRSKNSLYSNAGLNITDELPDADIYIGHYSSLLAIPISMKKKVLIIPISGHQVPEYFLINSHICESPNDIDNALIKQAKNTDISSVFSYPIENTKHIELIKSYLRKR